MTKTEIISSLPHLSQKDLKELRASIDILLKTSKTETTNKYKALYDTIMLDLKDKLRIKVVDYGIMKNRQKRIYTKLQEAGDFLDNYFQELIHPVKLTKTLKLRGYVLFSELMRKHILKSPLDLNISVMLNLYERFPEVFEKAFPGYSESPGAMSFVLKTNLKL